MALSYKNDSEADERLNPANSLDAREAAALDQIESGLKDDGFKGLDDQEKSAGLNTAAQDPNSVNYQPSKGTGTRKGVGARITSALSKRKGMIGLGGGLGGALIVLGFFGPATMLPGLVSNLSIGNDSSSVVMERRSMRILTGLLSGTNNDGLGKLKNKYNGKISNSALRKLSTKGIKPVINGSVYNPGRIGYPTQNPTHYEIDGPNGTKRQIPAADMAREMAGDRRLARKVLGTGGAFNFRVRAWAGKHISQRLFRKIPGFSKNGGVASNENKGKSKADRERTVREKARRNNSVSQKATASAMSSKARGIMGRAKKAGPAYTVAMAGCIATKAPRYLAAAVAGAQLLQLMPLVTDIAMSPGDKNKAAGFGSDFDSDDADYVGQMLTERHPNSDGVMKSALDSAIFLAALGVNQNRVDVSRAPGVSFMRSPGIQTGLAVEERTEAACNHVMSKEAMYGAMAADTAATLAASVTIIGGIAKLAGGFVISQVATQLIIELFKSGAEEVITSIAENDNIPDAKGEELGDYLGFAAMGLFSSGGMARFLPTLTMDQVTPFNAMRQENEQLQREMDIAALSPFDTSSRHTFLGSIVHTMGTAMLRNGTYSSNIPSVLSNIISLPAMALSYGSHVDAATNISATYCGYAKEFGHQTGNPATEPAINAAGLPCTGITPGQDSMSPSEAIDLLVAEGWLINDDAELADDATIDDLINDGTIVADTPMTDFIETCGDATSGDYLFNSTGCTFGGSGDVAGEINNIDIACFEADDGSTICASDSEDFGAGSDLPDLKDSRSLLAISVFLIDYQVLQSINGGDDEELPQSSESVTPVDDSVAGLPEAVGNIVSPIPPDMAGKVRTSARYGRYPSGGPHWGIDLTGGGDNGWEFVSVCDGVVDAVRINSSYANRNAKGVSGSTNYVWVKCDNGVYMGYAHFYANRLRSYITPGFRISAGTPIAPQGNQGNSTGAHLHFQINPRSSSGYSASATVDPAAYLQRLGVSLPRASY